MSKCQKRSPLIAGCLALTIALSVISPVPGWSADPIDESQRTAIEEIIHDYLMNNPEVLLRSVQRYQENQAAIEQDRIQAKLATLGNITGRDLSTPVGGNPDGPVTVVEFFDYQCGYCKRALPAVQELVTTDSTIRLVFMEFPILGEASVLAARASLAVWNVWPESYVDFHDALMGGRGSINERRIMGVAASLGLDIDQLRIAMDNPAIDEEIEKTHELAQSLGINGTPAFIIGSELVPGAIDLETMRQLVQQATQG